MNDHRELTVEQKKVWTKINEMMDASYGCAEAFVTAVGEYLWDEVDEPIKMISTGFSGGVGGTHEELCGGVSGAAIILGLLYGRTTNDESMMIRCKRLISDQRDRFVQEFGTTVCQELRDAEYGSDEDNPCSAMIAPAAFMLLDILEEEKVREKEAEKIKVVEADLNILPLDQYQHTHQQDDLGSLVIELNRPELPHEYRNWIGVQMSEINDTREGVGLTADGLPQLKFLPVMAGEVDIERAGKYQVDEFFISAYPLTYSQYQVFLDASDGYTNQAWWIDLAVKPDHINKSGDQKFTFDNHPRDNVSWFDAVAFCRWLSGQYMKNDVKSELPLKAEMIDKGYEFRLPTEWEWQMAATGGNKENKFPWGLDWNGKLAHTKHNQLNKSMAVGMYPLGKSPVGALDMSGNVWEWCVNCYENPSDLDLSRPDRRVLRGGSWYHWGSYAHTDMRSRYFPDHRYNAGGFRIACGIPLP